jgi:hypothetical protein
MPKRKPGAKRPLSPRAIRAAKFAARGLKNAQAAERAGYKSARARKGVTLAELKRDPRIVAIMADEMAKAMSSDEVQQLLGAQARGEVPTKITRGKKSYRTEYDTHAAAQDVAKIHQLFKDGAPPPPPAQRVEHSVAGMTDEELASILRGAGETLGLGAAHE